MKSCLGHKNFFVVLVLTALVGFFAEAAAAEPNLVSWWKFDEGSGTTAYDSAGTNHGAIYGAQWIASPIDGALSFDGVNDYVDCGNNESLQITGTEISLSAWVKWDSADNWSTIAMKASDESWRDGYGLYAHSDNTVNFYVTQWNVNVASKSFTADGLWHHVVGTYDGSNVRIYVDAGEGTPDSYTGSISNANHSLEIGRGIYNAYNFDGLIDDVRIYDRALSAEEIWQLYRATASFQGLGRYSEAYDVSADGCVVVGNPGYWTSSGGWQSLSGEAYAVSADGSVIVGYINSTNPPWPGYPEASRWTAEGGMQGLGLLPGRGHNQSSSSGVSADGSVVVGWSVGMWGGKSEAFRWTESDGMQSIGDLPGGKFWSQATDVSADGSVVVGVGNSASGIEAFRWTESGGFQALGDLPGGGFYSCGLNVSPDGSVVIGYSKSASGIEAFRWENGVMLGLGDLPGGGFGSRAYDVSANGSVVVGKSLIGDHPQTGNVAFIWDADHGMRNLKTLLENDYGLDLTGWRLAFARGISDDGLTIVGTGHSPDYPHNFEAWVVTFPGPATHYVDGDAVGLNDGSSWEDAFNYLQDALAAASSGDQIWVAGGTYKPDANSAIPGGTGSRTATFQLINGVGIYGGFAGYESSLDERDWQTNETILSGDIGIPVDNWDNSCHVVTGSNTEPNAILDGFTITAGNSVWFGGGGMRNSNSSPTVTNCTFGGNYSWFGGGMFNENSSPTLTNCTFSENSAANFGGGGMYNSNSNPTLTNCLLSGNSAGRDGGGMYNGGSASHSVLTNCTFSRNSAGWSGGGIYNEGNNDLTLTNCILWDNDDSGGTDEFAQIYGGTPVVNYCCIQGWTGVLGGTGNIDTDPRFVYFIDGDYHLLGDSPCIDAGDNMAVPADAHDLDGDGDVSEPVPFDLDSSPRFVDLPYIMDTGNGTPPIVDMGAYEAVKPPIRVPMRLTPQALNPDSKGNWVKAHFVLPEGFGVDDVDDNSPAKIWPLGIESDYIDVFINEDGLVEIEIAFDRAAFCGAGIDYGPAEVTVIGRLTSEQDFYGTDTIKIITGPLKHLAVLSSYWLEADCGVPDWCGGVDLDHSSMVDFIDFAMFDGCCIEVIKE